MFRLPKFIAQGAIGHLEVTHQTQRGDDRQSDDGHCHEGHRCSAVHRVALAKHDLRGWPDGKLTSLDSLYVKQVYTIYIYIYIYVYIYIYIYIYVYINTIVVNV